MANVADEAAAMFNKTVDAQYPAMQEQRAAMLSGIKLDLGVTPSGEQFSGAQAITGVINDQSILR